MNRLRMWCGVFCCTMMMQAYAAPNARQQTAPNETTITSSVTQKSVANYAQRREVHRYLEKVSKRQKIPMRWLLAQVGEARYSPLTEKYSTPKPNANVKTTPERNFALYARNLINDIRIENGAAFVKRNEAILERIEKRTGVDRYVIVGIIGVESIYGKNMGRFRVLDALMTLSFDYTRRAKYYQRELAHFLRFCYQERVPATSIQGSFAGAIGLGQFMPASLLAYGKDGDGDHHIDIVNNEADGIASVANFLKVHGWARGEKPLYRARATPRIFAATKSGGIKPHTTVGALLAAGVKPMGDWKLPKDDPALLVDLPWVRANDERGVDYYVGTPSFSAILHYNRSYFYAAAVSMLAERIRRAVRNPPQQASSKPTAA